uniref:Uncharacterized protein n=1 Tax=Amphora coffeiformis TaxID=265554 RepID=A0A7S3P3T1_9STRA
MTGLGFLSNPSAFHRSARSEEDSDSSGSFDTYESGIHSQSTSRADGGFFGDILAASEKAFGTVAHSLDMLFEEPFFEDESEEETIETISVDSVPRSRPAEGEEAEEIDEDAFVEHAFADEAFMKQAPPASSETAPIKNLAPKPKSIMKKRYQIPMGKYNFGRIHANKGDAPHNPDIARARSEEEIAADIMFKAVESWFGTKDSRTSSRVRFSCQDPSENNLITEEAVPPATPRQTPTDSTPQSEISRKEPKQKNPLGSDSGSASEPSAPSSPSEAEKTPSPAITLFPRLSLAEVSKKPDPETCNPNTKPQEFRTMETPKKSQSDGPVHRQNLTTSQFEKQPTPRIKRSIPQGVKLSSRPKNQVAKPVYGKGRKMRWALGGVWRAHRQGAKDKKHTDPIKRKEVHLKSDSGDATSPQVVEGRGLAFSIFPEAAPPTSKKRELLNTMGTVIVEKSFDMANICGNRGGAAKKGSFGLIKAASSSEAEPSSTVEKKETTGNKPITPNPSPRPSPNSPSESKTSKSDNTKPSKSPSAPIAASVSNRQLNGQSPSPSTPSKSMVEARSSFSSLATTSEPKRNGLLSAIRRRGKSLLNTENKLDGDGNDGLKTTIIMTDSKSSLDPFRAGRTADMSDDEDSAILDSDPFEAFRPLTPPIDGRDGFLCSNIASELSNRCSYRFQHPEHHQPLCHTEHFSELEGETSVHPFVLEIQGQIDSFIAGLTGSASSNRALAQALSTDENGQLMICKESGSPKGICSQLEHVRDTSKAVAKQDIKEFLDTYQNDLHLETRPSFSLDVFEGAFTQASKDLTDLAEGVTQSESSLTESESLDSDNSDQSQLVGDAGEGFRTATQNPETAHKKHQRRVPATTFSSSAKSKSKRKEFSARQTPPPLLYPVDEPPFPVSNQVQGRDYFDEEKSETSEWVDFGSKVVFHRPKLLRRFSHDSGEGKVSTPDRRPKLLGRLSYDSGEEKPSSPERRSHDSGEEKEFTSERRRRRRSKVQDLAFPVEIRDDKVPLRDGRQFVC